MAHLKIPVDISIILEAAVSKYLEKRDTHKIIIHVQKERLEQRYRNDYFKIKSEIASVVEEIFGARRQKNRLAVTNHRHIPYFSVEVDKKEARNILGKIMHPEKKFARTAAQGQHLHAIYNAVRSQVRYTPEAVAPYLPKARGPSLLEKIKIKADGLFNLEQMGAYTAHDNGFIGTGVNVATIDTGVDYEHQEFVGRFHSNKRGYDFVEGKEDPMDKNAPYFHGTHVSGTICGLNTGVAPGVNLYGLRVLDKEGFGLESDIIEAFMWCIDNGIHVANCSFGSANGSPVEEQALDVMINQYGIGVCAAAGNEGGRFISYPKGYGFPGLIGVAAVNSDNTWAEFSNIDPTNDISAYGVGILSACKGNIYQYMDGTSMATPHITGLYALILSYLGSASPAEIEAMIRKTATPLGDPDYFGAGRARADGFFGSQRAVANPSILKELLAPYR